MLSPQRLLGFAFASADLLLEINTADKISFAVGASEALSGSAETALVGRAWRDFIDPRDRMMVESLLTGLKDGGRGGPLIVTLAGQAGAPPRAVSFSAFRMPGNDGATSCALSRAAAKSVHGLHDKSSFEATVANLLATARATGQELELAMVELGGLSALRKLLSPEASQDLDQRVTGALRAQSHGGQGAADLGDDRYAVVRPKGDTIEAMVQRLIKLVTVDSASPLNGGGKTMALAGDVTHGAALRAIRYSLDTFIKDGMDGAPPASLNEAVNRSVQRTLIEVGALGQVVAEKRFKLVFQPVVDLKNNAAIHHYEALVRFGDNASPFPMIRMAEELDLIEPLDLAVVEATIAKMVADPKLSLAANISGRTICSPPFVESVRQMMAAAPKVAGRLLFEITESAAIDDLAVADGHLKALRSMGVQICLDDFGAGAASLAYLQQLTLDIVKIDGRYIRELQHGGRESTFIRHLVTMCTELGVKTLAEMVENSAAEEAVRRAGVDYAQGWFYGAPAEVPSKVLVARQDTLLSVKPAARRVGAVDGWS